MVPLTVQDRWVVLESDFFGVGQEATQRAVGQFDAAVLEIDAEEAEQLAAVDDAMRRLRVGLRTLLKPQYMVHS